MLRRRRIALIVLAVVLGLPTLFMMAYLVWRPTPPPGAPRIGLSMASSFVVQRPTYEAALARAGGESVLLTPVADDARVRAMLDDVDALLLTGEDDVDPALYRQPADPSVAPGDSRDTFEINLIRAALERDMPILGICRGIQILNVAHAGSIRDLRDDEALSERHGIGSSSFAAHDVDVAGGSRLAAVIGDGTHQVNSFHGQAVDRIGGELRICATADDGVVEGVERPDRTFVVGVQWHPEIASLTDANDLALLQALVERADAYRATRRLTSPASAREATE